MKKDNSRLYTMAFSKVYPLYIAKAERKGRTKEEVDTIICWLTGYTMPALEKHLKQDTDLEHFFSGAPRMNPLAEKITGLICGYRIEDIQEERMRQIRYLDKLIDDLAKGKPMEKILPQ